MEPARIYLFTTYRIEMANATVQLLCRAEGNPKPTITWFDRERNPIGPNTLGYKVRLTDLALLLFSCKF